MHNLPNTQTVVQVMSHPTRGWFMRVNGRTTPTTRGAVASLCAEGFAQAFEKFPGTWVEFDDDARAEAPPTPAATDDMPVGESLDVIAEQRLPPLAPIASRVRALDPTAWR